MVDDTDQDLMAVAKREGVSEQHQVTLQSTFAPLNVELGKAMQAAQSVSDGENPSHRKIARSCRLELRRIRCDIESVRKTAKADALRYGKAVDGIANVLKYICEPEEERLDAIEKHEERKEEARLAAMESERASELLAAGGNPAEYNLKTMSDTTWETIISAARRTKADREEAERQAEAERIEKQRQADAERARLIAENARLMAEAKAKQEKDLKDAELRQAAERRAAAEAQKAIAEAQAKARAEREAREAAERRAAEIETEKQRAEAERQEEAERMAKAPDKGKLIVLVSDIANIEVPKCYTKAGRLVASGYQQMRVKMLEWLRTRIDAL